MDKIAVLIPCFNEEKTIEKVVADFLAELPSASVYVYDNNSTDKTAQLAERAGAIVRKEKIQGKSSVIRRMFREIDAECYLLVDGDDTYSAKDAKNLTDKILNENYDMVIGDRLSTSYFTENKRKFHNTGNRIVRFFINYIFHTEYRDTLSGFRAFSYNFVKTFPVLSTGFQIETEMCIHAADKRMLTCSVPIDYHERDQDNPSKLNTVGDGAKILWLILRMFYQYKPAAMFNLISLILFLTALILFIPILAAYLSTGEVLRFPTLIVCGFMFLTAVQCFLSGISAQSRRWHDRESFEHELIKTDEERRDKKNKTYFFSE